MTPGARTRGRALGLFVVALALLLGACAAGPSGSAPRTARPAAPSAPVETASAAASSASASSPSSADAAAPTDWHGAVVPIEGLPDEARETMALIERGGPFPYEQDAETFGNREGRLPPRPRGHYREYTVVTPGSPDRGARRIVAGEDGELYYTDDHYESFRLVSR